MKVKGEDWLIEPSVIGNSTGSMKTVSQDELNFALILSSYILLKVAVTEMTGVK